MSTNENTTMRKAGILLAAASLMIGACSSDNASVTSVSSSATQVTTESQREVLLAEAACTVTRPEDVAAAFDRQVVDGGNDVGVCRYILEPGLGGADQVIVQATLWPDGDEFDAAAFFERQRTKDLVEEVAGSGFPALVDPITSAVWTLIEPTSTLLPGRAADLGTIDLMVLDLQVLLPGVGVAPPEVRDEILDGLGTLSRVIADRL